MSLEAARITTYRNKYKPQMRAWINASKEKLQVAQYDTIPRFRELAGRLGIPVASKLEHLNDLHRLILGKYAYVDLPERSCAGQDMNRFHAAFDIIGEILTGWDELRQDLSRLSETQLAKLVHGVFNQLVRVGNFEFNSWGGKLPDEVLEQIGNILIRASLV